MSGETRFHLPRGWVPVAGLILLAAWAPLIWLPTLRGTGVAPFLASFLTAGLAYIWAVKRLDVETPAPWLIWGFAVLFRAALLLTPVSLSDDVYRYIWDGHLMGQGINPYAQIVQSPLLDAYATPLRALVNHPWMATPYLPAAQVYFAVIERLAPQSPFTFQLAAALLDLSAGLLISRTLAALNIPTYAVLLYLWNPLVIVEFSHGAHVDALMVFFFALALRGFVTKRRGGLTLSAVALAAAVLVKGWPILAAPLFARRLGVKRLLIFTICLTAPLALFASQGGWGIFGPLDGRGVFGALRIFAASWSFNSGLFKWIALLAGESAARVISVLAPVLASLLLGIRSWKMEQADAAGPTVEIDHAAANRTLVRRAAVPFGLYLLLAPTIHPWYLTLVLSLLPFFWPGTGETARVRRWVWPWIYFMFFEAATYLAYSGISAPFWLDWLQTAAYFPFWLLLLRAGVPDVQNSLDLSRI